MAYTGSYSMPAIGGRMFSRARFNDQTVGEAFLKAAKLSGAATPFGVLQGLSGGQYFTGEGGTEYRTVAGIDPNQPGWGTRVPTGYELIGYQRGSGDIDIGDSGRSRPGTPGFAILKKIAPKVEEPAKPVEPPTIVDPPPEQPKEGDDPVDQGPTMLDLANALGKQVGDLKTAFTDILAAQGEQMRTLQESQTANMEALTNAMMQAQAMQQQRPQVAGVKMAAGAAGTPMQIARRGVTGAFGRRGMRISSLNV